MISLLILLSTCIVEIYTAENRFISVYDDESDTEIFPIF